MRAQFEPLDPVIASGLATVVAILVALIMYLLLDVVNTTLAANNPTYVALQMAGITAAVSSAPERAIYCYEALTPNPMSVTWIKGYYNTSGAVVVFAKPARGQTLEAYYETGAIANIGPMPIPFTIAESYTIQHNKLIIVGIYKDRDHINVTIFNDTEECGGWI